MKVERGSGNVFKDLGFSPSEAANLQLRAQLMSKIRAIITAELSPSYPRCRPPGRGRKLSGMRSLDIQQMSREEKLRAMEELWESLSSEPAQLESPAWHGDALHETERRHEAGQEELVDWAVAKQELRLRSK